MKKMYFFTFLSMVIGYLFFLCPINSKNKEELIIGVKLYELPENQNEFFALARSLYINTLFISPVIAADKPFMDSAKNMMMKTFIILPIFYSPDKLVEDPSLFAVNGKGEKAKDDWVEFVCPNQENYKKDLIHYICELVKQTQPHGLSIDFIRNFVFWEKISPEAAIDPFETTCFCNICLKKFRNKLPDTLQSTTEIASWIFENRKENWTNWRCDVITSTLKDIVREVRKEKKDILINLHLVPWRKNDFDNALKFVASQDIKKLSPFVDYFSPMCYAHMLKRDPSWIGDVVKDAALQTTKPLIPSIQVSEEYTNEKLIPAFFKEELAVSLRNPSYGVIFWNWNMLQQSKEKQDIVRGIFQSKL